MSVRDTYLSLTESALEALSSKGLVRRAVADLAGGKVRLASETDTTIEVAADGETVRLDAAGVMRARCSCRAPSLCRHRLAAILLLQRETHAPEASPADAGPSAVSWTDVLADMSDQHLERWAGRAAAREAHELVARANDARVIDEGRTLRVRLDDKEPEIVIPSSGGLDAIVSTVPARRRKRVHAAAVLAARRHFGLATASPSPAGAEPETPATVDPAFIEATKAALEQCFLSGFAVAPRTLQERLMSLAVSGRAQAMPRLAALLRTIAAGIEERRSRDANHDARAFLARIASAYALASALAVPRDPSARAGLAGVVRQSYEPVGDLRLFGVGAELWERASGATGVTAYFYDAGQARWYTATLGRANANDVTFSPASAFRNEVVWGATLDRLNAGTVSLTGARASDGGRLSLGRETRSTVAPWTPTVDDVSAWGCVFTDWRRLGEALDDVPSLAIDDRPSIPVILKPSRTGAAYFDDISQSLIWPVADQNGVWLALRLPHEGLMAARLERLERLMTTIRPWAIVATASVSGDVVEITPFGLWARERFLLDFPDRSESTPGAVARIFARLRQAAQTVQGQRLVRPVAESDHTARLLTTALDALVRDAEMGGAVDPSNRQDALRALSDRFRAAGLDPVARQLDGVMAAAASGQAGACLRAAFAIGSVQQLRIKMPYLVEAAA